MHDPLQHWFESWQTSPEVMQQVPGASFTPPTVAQASPSQHATVGFVSEPVER